MNTQIVTRDLQMFDASVISLSTDTQIQSVSIVSQIGDDQILKLSFGPDFISTLRQVANSLEAMMTP